MSLSVSMYVNPIERFLSRFGVSMADHDLILPRFNARIARLNG